MKRMREGFERGSLTRRDFMQGLMALGIGAAGTGVFVASSRDVQAMTPKREAGCASPGTCTDRPTPWTRSW